MGRSGFTSELHSSTSAPSVTRTTPTSLIRSYAAFPPVVSKSTNTRSRGSSSTAAIERHQGMVEVGPPVAEHAPRMPIAAHILEVEGGGQHGFAHAIRLGHFLAGRRGDERRAIEGHGVLVALFSADAIRSHHRHDVGRGMTLHGALPMPARVDARILGFRTDGRGIEQHVRAQQRHGPRRLRKPLIPADRDAEPGIGAVEYLETGVARREVELLVVARAL